MKDNFIHLIDFKDFTRTNNFWRSQAFLIFHRRTKELDSHKRKTSFISQKPENPEERKKARLFNLTIGRTDLDISMFIIFSPSVWNPSVLIMYELAAQSKYLCSSKIQTKRMSHLRRIFFLRSISYHRWNWEWIPIFPGLSFYHFTDYLREAFTCIRHSFRIIMTLWNW